MNDPSDKIKRVPGWWRDAMEYEIRGGARWAYALGVALTSVLVLQMLSGWALMATYVPSTRDAWSSVFYIQHRVASGAFVRGLHHYGAQAVMIVVGLHLLQVVLYGAYKKPRQTTWWFGLGLLALVSGLAVTGYLLPWDQKGYWATTVATNIAGSAPVLGPAVRTVLVGGAEYGQSTLTRLFMLHVGVLPSLVALVLAWHARSFRREGPTAPWGADVSRVETYAPRQFGRDVLLSVFVLGAVACVAAFVPAPLDAPADPSVEYPPRPEWYFLWLYELLNLVPGPAEKLVSLGVPFVGALLLALLPVLDRGTSLRVRDRVAFVAPVFFAALAIAGLTAYALHKDANDAKFQAQRGDADVRAARAVELARQGIPPEGPLAMLAADPWTRGRDLFIEKCSSCHVIDGQGEHHAPDHTRFASREWILGLLRDPQGAAYFHGTELDGMPSQASLGDEQLRAVTEFLLSRGREPQDPALDEALVIRGASVFETKCMTCHVFEDDGDYLGEGGPDLTRWGSRTWIARQITHPADPGQYGEANEMPAFEGEFTDADLRVLTAYVRLLRFGSSPAAAPPRTGR